MDDALVGPGVVGGVGGNERLHGDKFRELGGYGWRHCVERCSLRASVEYKASDDAIV